MFYNDMVAVAQCPNNWGVGSAFHPKKIHIFKGKGHMGSWSFWSAGLCWWWWWGGAEKKRCRAHGALGKLGQPVHTALTRPV